MGLQSKHTYCSKTFTTGPSKIGNVVCQMENQTLSRKNRSDYILQVHTRQKNRTQPETIWRDTKNLSSSEISRHYFRLQTQLQKVLYILDRCNTRYHLLRLLVNKNGGLAQPPWSKFTNNASVQFLNTALFRLLLLRTISPEKFSGSKTNLYGLPFICYTSPLSCCMIPLAFHMWKIDSSPAQPNS